MIELVPHWAGGKHSTLQQPHNRTGSHCYCASREVVTVIRDLVQTLPDRQIARDLNRLCYRTGADNTWTQARVMSLRTSHQFPGYVLPAGEPMRSTITGAARLLDVYPSTVQRWISAGNLPGSQPEPYAPWGDSARDPHHLGRATRRESDSGGASPAAINSYIPSTFGDPTT